MSKRRTLIRAGLPVLAAFIVFAASAAGRPAEILPRDRLPDGFAVGSGAPALGLKVTVVEGRVTASAAAPADEANVRATRGGDAEQTVLNVRTELDVALKFDLYVSRDGQTFQYASSCAVTPGISSFEMWKYPVAAFAIGNPRVVSAKRFSCD